MYVFGAVIIMMTKRAIMYDHAYDEEDDDVDHDDDDDDDCNGGDIDGSCRCLLVAGLMPRALGLKDQCRQPRPLGRGTPAAVEEQMADSLFGPWQAGLVCITIFSASP